ncbi:MAG: FHA domain-containing protein [Planctomycetota bacterium]|jgi:pSer/pThr/pTyr-binding forkhead associated (FHA) protein
MSIHPQLGDFKTEHQSTSRDDFLAKYKSPFLIVQYGGAGEKIPEEEEQQNVPQWDRTSWDTKGIQGGLLSIVASLEKTGRNDEEEAVTLGRIEENDVVIPHPSVSKRHLLFRIDSESGDVTAEEAGSTYGTLLNGEPLMKGVPSPLENQATFVIAGSALASFFHAESFYEFLHPPEEES